MLVAPDGENPIVGAILGGITEAGIQIIENTGSGNRLLDLADITVATFAGAASSGLCISFPLFL